ncbi:hypothetical protein I6N95_25740 [Vagococcus sp. BWB3-3]|uniref:RRN7-type domain-containing protein n=1 Tax=Vagococcus allomyrinae TaxID=2794353 RepID=A0A940SXK1_9ENTE|nr:CFI-box-CTERM domain-containing protein [Vagococcus allomyrinae]MBP1044415.1 hypothetical protein [Vagococcus allomyrinae]
MKKIVCELCGSNDFTKENGYWVCNHCQTKYTPEEAKKITVEGIVDVSIDKTTDLHNFQKLAIQYYNSSDFEQAKKYYSKILEINPEDWQATFYYGICSSKLSNLASFKLMDSVNSAKNAINIILKADMQEKMKTEHIIEIVSAVNSVTISYQEIAFNHYNQYWEMESSTTELIRRLQICSEAYTYCFDLSRYFKLSISQFQISLAENVISICIEICQFRKYKMYVKGTELEREYQLSLANRQKYITIYQQKVAFIKSIQPEYVPPRIEDRDMTKAQGCYIATSVYKTYDCSELWTLRRFRDETLNKSVVGRLFIKFYYLVSPKIIRVFGENKIFNGFCKLILDKFVKRLQLIGVSSTEYEDS